MSQLPAGFVLDTPKTAGGLPEGFVINEQVSASPEGIVATEEVVAQPKEKGFFDTIGEMITGSDRMTPEMESIEEIGSAPELNEMSMAAFKTSLGLLATGDTEKAKGVLEQNLPGVQFTEDKMGNVIVNLPSGQYALNKPGTSAQDIVRGAFNLASFTPAGRAATIGKAGAGAALTEGAIQGAASSVGGGEIDAGEVALAGVLGAGGKALEDLISTGYRVVKGKLVGPEKEIIEAGKAADVPVMTSDVIEPKTFVGKSVRSVSEKNPILGMGVKREAQQESREAAAKSLLDKYQEPSYKEIVDSIKNKSKGIKIAAGSVLSKTGDKLDSIGEISVDQTKEAIDSAIGQLSKANVRTDSAAIDELSELKALMDIPQTFTSLKENRTIAREILETFGKGERSQLPSRSKSLIQKAVTSMGHDMDKVARENLTPQEFTKWKRANAVYAEEAKKLKKTKIKQILDKGDITPEVVEGMLFSKKPSEVDTLYKSLTKNGRDNARSALIQKAFDNSAKRAGGMTPSTFAAELKKLSGNTGTFFKGEEKAQLEGLKRLLGATHQAQAAGVQTASGQQLIPYLIGGAATSNPLGALGVGATAGMLSRIYESPQMRNALLRLASVPRGSTRFLEALEEARALMQSVSQTALSSET